jgi:rhodanese-related sulfurtransferase
MKCMPAVLFLFITIASFGQFKADNVKYTTVYPSDLCKTLLATKGYVLLDVRSQGEYDDTSSSGSLNIGHLKNALHIDIRELPNRWRELLPYKDQAVFVYCSHSQRSRRASRLLSDSGFTKIYNINGGLTDFYIEGIADNPCASYIIERSAPYNIISAKQLDENTAKGTSYYIIDLRDDSTFRGISSNERNQASGKFKGAVNIPFTQFISQGSYTFPDKSILLVDNFGDESVEAAKQLASKGFKNVSILFNGMDAWMDYLTMNIHKPHLNWEQAIDYKIISPDVYYSMQKKDKNVFLLDARTKEEFSNASKNYWQNIGIIQTATNIPAADLKSSNALPNDKNTAIVIYGFNGEIAVYNSAKWLAEQGYKNVNVLRGGIWGVRWTSHNIKDKAYLNELVVNVPADNL